MVTFSSFITRIKNCPVLFMCRFSSFNILYCLRPVSCEFSHQNWFWSVHLILNTNKQTDRPNLFIGGHVLDFCEDLIWNSILSKKNIFLVFFVIICTLIIPLTLFDLLDDLSFSTEQCISRIIWLSRKSCQVLIYILQN